jgi:hypothetical protein
MSVSRVAIVAGFVVAFASLAGCSTQSAEKESDDVASIESELKLSGTRYLGKLTNGETRTGYYYNPPRYRSFGFDAKGGDEITVDIKSAEGDAVGYVTDSSYNVLAYNDDASISTLDSKVTYKVPAGQTARSFRIVFRDYDLLDATFTIKLGIKSSAVQTTCAYDGETYTAGETFPSTDGCNTCTCGSNGSVGCTKRACACDPANEPWRSYIGTPQQCMTIRYTCSAGKVPFQNACGCGCETP